jgi:HlyD family type I secretion membrane fusion protein
MSKHGMANRGDWRRPMTAGIAVIIVTFGVFGGWAAFARLDSAIVATGQVVVESERKQVQHLEGGIVSEILVSGDSSVKLGDVLVRLDATSARANAAVAGSQLAAALAEEARLTAELAGAERIVFPPSLESVSPDAARAREDQERQFRERRAARANERAVLEERIEQAQRSMAGFAAQIVAGQGQSRSYEDEMTRLSPLAERGLIVGSRIRQLERAKLDQDGRIGSLLADRERQERVIAESRLQIEGISRKTAEEASARLATVRGTIAELRDRIAVATDIVRRGEIRAPRAGRIVGLKVHTIGAVVRPGDVLMEIVPEDDTLVVEAHLQPIDVTHVHPGLAAEVRLPAFKARTTPLALGEVRSVSADVIQDPVSRQSYYTVTVSARASSFPAEIRDRLVPGMPAEVIVATGERTVAEYLTQPLGDAFRRGMREP